MMDLIHSQLPILPSPNLAQLAEHTSLDGHYEGELKSNFKHGLGVFIWRNGDAYFGAWQDDKMHGKGIFCYNTGHYVEGIFDSNLVEGPACITYPDRSFTKGFFKKGELNGYALFYQTEKNKWMLQEYEEGKLKGVSYEGFGKPISYNFFSRTIEGNLGVKKDDINDASYTIQATRKDLAPSFSIGCFELEGGIKHYGVIKNHNIEGLGIKIQKNCIEVGKFRNEQPDSFGWRLEFGRLLYEGEFILGKYYGKGTLREWTGHLLMTKTGIFLDDALAHKFNEESNSLPTFNAISHINASGAKIMDLTVRNFEDAFTKNYTLADSQVDDSQALATTIKEIVCSRMASRETVLDCQDALKESPRSTIPDSLQNSPSRRALLETASHLAKMVNASNNDPHDITLTLQACQGYIDNLKQKFDDRQVRRQDEREVKKPKRSRSSDRNTEPAFSQVFSISVDDKPQSCLNSHRSASRDAARYGNVTVNFPQVAVNTQFQGDNQRNFEGANFTSYVNKMNNYTDATREREDSESCTISGIDYKPSQSNNDISSLNFLKRLSSPGVNSWYTHEPSTSGVNFSPLITHEKDGFDSNIKSESASPLLSAISKKLESGLTHKPYAEEQRKTLVKGQKSSRSSTDLHAAVDVNVRNNGEKIVKASAYMKETSPARNVLNINTSKLTRDRSSPSLNSSRGTASSISKLPVDKVNRPKTPTKNVQAKPNSNIKTLEKKESASKMKTPLPKTQKNPVSTVSNSKISQRENPSPAYPGHSPYGKKSTNVSIRNNNTDKQEFTARKSARLTGDSPAQVVELDLYSYSLNSAAANEKKQAITPEKSANPVSRWSEQKSAYLNEQHSYPVEDSASRGLTQSSMSTEKQSARGKTPLISNVVNIDISMFRETPSLSSELQNQSPVKVKLGLGHQDHLTLGHADNNNYLLSGRSDQEFGQVSHHHEYKMDGQEKKTTALNLNFTNTISASGTGLHDFALETFDRRKKEDTEGDMNIQGENPHVKHHKIMVGHNVNTPSFSLTGQKNIKFTTGDSEKINSNTPRKGGRREQVLTKSRSQQNENQLKRSSSEVQTTPRKAKVESPYKIDVQKQKFSILSKSPDRNRSPDESPAKACESSSKIHESSSFDSSRGYPVKRTCQLKGSCCNESHSSCSPQRASSQQGSPTRRNKEHSPNSGLASPDRVDRNVLKGFGSVNQFSEPSSLGLSSHRREDVYLVQREVRDKEEYKTTFQAILPATINATIKYENIHENYSNKLTGQFGCRSNSTTPRKNLKTDLSDSSLPKYSVIEPENDEKDYFSSQPENFMNRTDLKRPKLVVESKIPTGQSKGSHRAVQKGNRDGKTNLSRSNSKDKSPTKSRRGELSNRRVPSDKGTSTSRSSAHEEAQSLYCAHFGTEGNKLVKSTSNSQNHPHVQIRRLPEEIRTVLNPKGHSDVKVHEGKYKEESEQRFGNTTIGNFKSPRDIERSKSVNKVQSGRPRSDL